MTPTDGPDRGDGRRRLAHDAAGHAYPTAVTPTTGDGRSTHAGEPVASRTTEEEARDLLGLRRAKRGDTASFAALLQANDPDVRAFLAALVGRNDLDAVTTQVYLRAFRGLPIAPATSPRLWLLGIADGAARYLVRHARQSTGSEAVVDAPIPTELPHDERLVLAAVEAVGLTSRETARLTGATYDQVRETLAAGRARPDVDLPLDDPPEHGPRFWDDLGRRLLVEQSAPAATGRHRTVPAAAADTPADDLVASPRSAEVARAMAARVEQQHPRTFPWKRVGTALALVVAVTLVIGFALSLAGKASRRDAGLGETAAKTLNRLDASLARSTVVQGTVQITTEGEDAVAPGVYRFSRSNTGSWRLTALDGSLDEGYEQAEGTAVTVQNPGNGAPTTATERIGLAPGPPSATAVSEHSPGDVLANVIRAVRGGTAGTVETRTEEVTSPSSTTGPATTASRAVWIVTSTLDSPVEAPLLAGSGTFGAIHADEAELVADQSLALPTELTLRRNGATVLMVRFSGLTISQQPTGSSHLPEIPPGTVTTTTDAGFTPAVAGQLTGARSTPTPSYLPGGYVLTGAAVNASGSTTVVCYRNGSRQLVLTVRPVASTRERGRDPLATDRSDGEPDELTIATGSLAGSSGRSSGHPIAHVWVNGSKTQVVAVGDPPVAQLTKVVSSLR